MPCAVRIVSLALLLVGVGLAIEREPLEVFQERRRRLASAFPDGAIVLLGFEADEGRPGPSRFRQQNEFYYLTGWNEPGAAALILPAYEGEPYREILFVPAYSPHGAMWSGVRLDPTSEDAEAQTGFLVVEARDQLRKTLRQAVKKFGGAYGLSSAPREGFGELSRVDQSGRLREIVGRDVEDIRTVVDEMRQIKSTGEIRLIEKAVEASVQAHLAVLPAVRPGRREYQLQSVMTAALLEAGSERHAYAPIVAAGSNSLVLHYTDNEDKLSAGEVVLIDVGGEYSFYAGDLTRTLPVSGRFSKRQRELYDTVLEAHQAVLAAVRPGVTLDGHGANSLSQIARDVFEEKAPGLSRYFPHSVGHHVGLAVHDPADPLTPLEAGMVITVEPGLYLSREGFGVRIEDVVLVTEDGARVLSAMLPRRPEEIERLMANSP